MHKPLHCFTFVRSFSFTLRASISFPVMTSSTGWHAFFSSIVISTLEPQGVDDVEEEEASVVGWGVCFLELRPGVDILHT